MEKDVVIEDLAKCLGFLEIPSMLKVKSGDINWERVTCYARLDSWFIDKYIDKLNIGLLPCSAKLTEDQMDYILSKKNSWNSRIISFNDSRDWMLEYQSMTEDFIIKHWETFKSSKFLFYQKDILSTSIKKPTAMDMEVYYGDVRWSYANGIDEKIELIKETFYRGTAEITDDGFICNVAMYPSFYLRNLIGVFYSRIGKSDLQILVPYSTRSIYSILADTEVRVLNRELFGKRVSM